MSLVVEERPHALAHVPEDLLAPSDLARCLSAVLWVMGWSGGADDLIAALPHAKPDIDLTDLRTLWRSSATLHGWSGSQRAVWTFAACRLCC